MSELKEKWKIIKGYYNYFFSNHGLVLSLCGKQPRFLKPRINKKGYEQLVLCNNGIPRTFEIQVLVAKHFLPNPENKPIVDHIDSCKINNKINNLRWVTSSENNMNRLVSSNNSSGVKGVSFHKRNGKYRARIQINKRNIHIGYYKTLEEAKLARQNKAKELFGEFISQCELM